MPLYNITLSRFRDLEVVQHADGKYPMIVQSVCEKLAVISIGETHVKCRWAFPVEFKPAPPVQYRSRFSRRYH